MTDAEQQRIANIEHEAHMKGFEVGRDIGRKEERARIEPLLESARAENLKEMNKVSEEWIETGRQEEREEQNRIHNSGRKLFQEGERVATARLIALAEGMKVSVFNGSGCKCGREWWFREKHNKIISDFITRANQEERL